MSRWGHCAALVSVAICLISTRLPAQGLEFKADAPRSYVITAPFIEGTEDNVRAWDGVRVVTEFETLEADEIQGDLNTGLWVASGGVKLQRESDLLEASEIAYNLLTRSGTLKQGRARYGIYYVSGESLSVEGTGSDSASDPEGLGRGIIARVSHAQATTCNLARPHWALGAESIEVRPGQYAVARRVGVSIGGRRLFAVPTYRFSLRRSQQIMPTPGYNRDDGVYMRFRTPFSVPWATASEVNARLSQRNGIAGLVQVQRTISGPRSDQTPEIVPEVVSDFNTINLLDERFVHSDELQAESERVRAAEGPELRAFAKLGINERVFDPDLRYLNLDRRPEFGLRMTDIPVARIARSDVTADCQIGYGTFREENVGLWHSRWDARALATTSLDVWGGLEFRPSFILRAAGYSTGDSLRTAAWLLRVGKRLSPNYFAVLTHIRHWTTGKSAFRFDDVDVKEKLGAGLETDWGRTKGRFSTELDLARGGVYDWGFDIARTMHCYEPSVSYRHRYRDITVSVSFVAASY